MPTNNTRLALLAIAMPAPNSAQRLAIAIGTCEDDQPDVWRVGLSDADALAVYLRDGDPSVATLFDLPPPVGLLQHWFGATTPVGVSDGEGDETEPRIAQPDRENPTGRLWIDRIVRMHFYRGDQYFHGGMRDMPAPLVRLDTAGFIDGGGGVFGPEWVVSRLRLDRIDAWPANVADVSTSIALTAFRLACHIPLAVNAHAEDSDPDARAKRFDTRAVLRAAAIRDPNGRQPLWGDRRQSARFTSLTLGLSDALHLSEPSEPRTLPLLYTFDDLTGGNQRPHLRDNPGAIVAPALALIPALADVRPTFGPISRELGFRTALLDNATSPAATRLILRAELGLSFTGKRCLVPWNAMVAPYTGLAAPHDLRPDDGLEIRLAQEQRMAAIATDLGGTHPGRWLFTIRIDRRDAALGSVTRQILAKTASFHIPVALRALRPETGMSVLPAITVADRDNTAWHLIGELADQPAYRRLFADTAKPVAWSAARDPRRTLRFTGLQPRRTKDLWVLTLDAAAVPANIYRPAVTVIFDSITRTDGARLASADAAILQPTDSTLDDGETMTGPAWQPISEPGIGFALTATTIAGDDDAAQRLRIGALEFAVSGSSPLVCRFVLAAPMAAGVGTHMQLSIDATSARATDQDALPPQARAESLGADGLPVAIADDATLLLPLVSLPLVPSRDRIALALIATEYFGDDRDQAVEWRLRAKPGDRTAPKESGRLLVIDSRPFRIAAVDAFNLNPDDRSHEIAVWQAGDDGRPGWRLRDPDERIGLVLPPQIIGEAMEKAATGVAGRPADIAPGEPADARFGSLTRLAIDPTWRETNSREPGWNLRRILNRVSDATPGALLRDARIEIAYGMTARHMPIRETWLAEMAGVIGAPPMLLATGNDDDADFRVRSNAILTRQASRIAVDKFWTSRPEADFEITEGLTFTLRTPTGGTGPAAKFRFPAPNGYPPPEDSRAAMLHDSFAKPGSAGDAESFAGGVPWAFEDAGVLHEVYANPHSTDGRVSDLHLSALGGWGQQRALFAEGKTAIETETAMGRMSAYKLERIGRIGGLGNRAKHVIVYRRTVAPSAQFFNRMPIGLKQDEHVGRPILRKVEEYVEILEPERRYPENGTAVLEAGCLSGSRFVSRRILVDSDWGGSVRNQGWMVPLWNRDFATLAPDPYNPDNPANLYRKPLIQLLMAGEDGSDVAIEIDTPERLVFYTSIVPGDTGQNVDEWRAVEGIDFCDAPAPVVREREWAKAGNSDLHDGVLPGAPRSAGGHDPLTLGLVDARGPVRIGAGRVTGGPAAVLKNVTISRARPLPMEPIENAPLERKAAIAGAEAAAMAASVRGRLDRLFGAIPGRFAALGREGLNGKERAIQAIDDCRQSLKDELASLQAKIAKEATALKEGLEDLRIDPAAIASRRVTAVRQTIEGERKRLLDTIHHTLDLSTAIVIDHQTRLADAALMRIDTTEAALAALSIGAPVEAARVAIRDFIDQMAIATAAAVDSAHRESLDEIDKALALIAPPRGVIERLLDLQGDVAAGRAAIVGHLQQIDETAKRIETTITTWQLPPEARTFKDFVIQGIATCGTGLIEAGLQFEKLGKAARIAPDVATMARRGAAACAAITATVDMITASVMPLDDDTALRAAAPQILDTLRILRERTAAIVALLGGSLEIAANDFMERIADLIAALHLPETVWRTTLRAEIDAVFVPLSKDIVALHDAAHSLLNASGAATADHVETARSCAIMLRQTIASRLRALIAEARTNAEAIVGKITTQATSDIATVDAAITAAIEAIDTQLRAIVTQVATATTAPAGDRNDGLARLQGQLTDVSGLTDTDDIARQIDRFADALRTVIDKGADTIDAARKAIEDAVAGEARRLSDRVDGFLGEVQGDLARAIGIPPDDLGNGARYLYQEGDNVLRLIRAVGDPPVTDSLGFNRPEIAYGFDLLKPIVDITPALALANRVNDTVEAAERAGQAIGQVIEAFGGRSPIAGIGDALVPDALKGLSLSRLFPDMGGLDLEGLLKDAGFPDLAGADGDAVKITRGFDKERRGGWMQADIDVKLDKPASILDFGPVKLMLVAGRFTARTRMVLAASGQTEQEASGAITGDWQLVTGGMDVITFEKTPLKFDKSGKLDFAIASNRVRLAPTLKFLTDLIGKLGKSVPPGIEPVMRDGKPAGIVARLAMDLPPVQAGVFGITDLTLGASFAIIALPEFEIAISLDIAARDAPFTLSVWLLNGGGYIAQRLSFRPMARPAPVLTYMLDIAIVAGVGIGFGFGVVSGGVWLQIGCSVALTWTTGRGGNVTTVTAFLLARGSVDVAGLVTAGISLRLEISYDGNTMIARGVLRLRFRISSFYTLRVNQQVRYTLIGKSRPAPDTAYSDSFG